MKKTIISIAVVLLALACTTENQKAAEIADTSSVQLSEKVQSNEMDKLYSHVDFMKDIQNFQDKKLLNDTTGFIMVDMTVKNIQNTDSIFYNRTYNQIIDSIYANDKERILNEIKMIKEIDLSKIK